MIPAARPVVKRAGNFRTGNETIARYQIAEGVIRCLGDPNAGSQDDAAGFKLIVSDPKGPGGICQVASVVAVAGDAESCTQPPGTAGKPQQILFRMKRNASLCCHLIYAGQRLQSTE